MNDEWFFQAMLLIIGGRYLTLATIYSKRVYWILGTIIGISTSLLFKLKIQSLGSLLTGSLIEISWTCSVSVIPQKQKGQHFC
ncbi:DUF7010 family protein [Aquirufa beregesia]